MLDKLTYWIKYNFTNLNHILNMKRLCFFLFLFFSKFMKLNVMWTTSGFYVVSLMVSRGGKKARKEINNEWECVCVCIYTLSCIVYVHSIHCSVSQPWTMKPLAGHFFVSAGTKCSTPPPSPSSSGQNTLWFHHHFYCCQCWCGQFLKNKTSQQEDRNWFCYCSISDDLQTVEVTLVRRVSATETDGTGAGFTASNK